MKNLNIISLSIFLLFTLSLFTSCDKEEFENNELIGEEITQDTIIIDNEMSYRIDNQESQLFQGATFSCPNPDITKNNYVNVIAFGEDLVIDENGEATYTKNIYSLFWQTDGEAETGNFLAYGLVQTTNDDEGEALIKLSITAFTEKIIVATFEGTILDPVTEELISFSGNVNLDRINCEVLEGQIPSEQDIETTFVTGTTSLAFENEPFKTLSSIYTECPELLWEEEGIAHFQFIADAFIGNEDFTVKEISGLQYFVYHRELEDLELNKEYSARFGAISEGDLDQLKQNEDYILSITEPITLTYTSREEYFLNGEFNGQNGDGPKASFRSMILNCDE